MKKQVHQLEERLVLLEERVMAFGLVQIDQRRSHEYDELTREAFQAMKALKTLDVQDQSTNRLRRRADGVLAELICMQPQMSAPAA